MNSRQTTNAKQTINSQGLSAQAITVGYEHKKIVRHVSLQIPTGKISVILGANGCGKSTLLKAFSRLLKPWEGTILLDGKETASLPPKQLAKRLGLLPQSPIVPEGIKVSDLVSRGRFPYRHWMGSMSQEDFRAVSDALAMVDMTDYADESVDELSGGQRQRVWLALALAQQTDLLLLDEPTTYLDISHQIEILDLLKDLNQKRKTTIAMVLHDINLSARYADYLFAMKKGELVAEGPPKEIITPELIHLIYDLDCLVIDDPVSHTPSIIPKSRHYS